MDLCSCCGQELSEDHVSKFWTAIGTVVAALLLIDALTGKGN